MQNIPLDQWGKIRAYYEAGNTGNQTAEKFGINRRRLQMRIQKEGWSQNLERTIQVQALEKVIGRTTSFSVEATAEAVDNESTLRATIEKRHREEPNNIRILLYRAIKAMGSKESPLNIKELKLVAETMALLHRMERDAFRLNNQDVTGDKSTEIFVTAIKSLR